MIESTEVEQDGPAGYSADDLHKIGNTWMTRIKAAEKREKDWTEEAEKAEAIYLCSNEHGRWNKCNA